MCGDEVPSIQLAGGATGGVIPAIQTLDMLARRLAVPFALVGGLAVMARLGESHRATADVDTVYLDLGDNSGRHRAFVAAGGILDGESVELNGVKIDAIEVDELAGDDLPPDLLDRSFVLSHKWALDTATPVRIIAAGAAHSTAAVVPTASAAALIAMKLSAFPRRRPARRIDKQASDLHDIYRLLTAADVSTLRRAYAGSPFDLAQVSSALAGRLLDEYAADTIRALGSDPLLDGVTLDDLAAVIETLVEATR